MQEILILLIFLAAVAYLVRMFWRQAKSNEPGCAKGCGGCSTLNPDLIEKQIKAANRK
ncbi:FeoB-associated Cys-rich membrane protein [Adhaeribacter soli]|uniref:FeoB-associated Cys-rich membrane protein n=1 Tax=Adhaeribacter soli TaxID=2607655 RepID=A0A5N1J092_9BACT|nr:FeoB-associated Cys-rich membrane protein [Adhaeribacter soli]KAA9340040.1 FeoB-associated Cys-rich membrane protein [Adhaeribacter soli]